MHGIPFVLTESAYGGYSFKGVRYLNRKRPYNRAATNPFFSRLNQPG
jgi:hypothetical protein